MTRETSSPKLPSPGGGGTAANHSEALSLSFPLLHPSLGIRAQEPPVGTPLLWLPRLLLTPRVHRNPTAPASGSWASSSTSGTAGQSGNSIRRGTPGHRASRCQLAMSRRAGNGREGGAGTGGAGLDWAGRRELTSVRGPLERGAGVPPAQRRSCCSRSGGCGGPAGAALGFRADALPRSAAAREVAEAAAAAVEPATARPYAVNDSLTPVDSGLRCRTAAPALSACAPSLAQVRGVCLQPAGRARPRAAPGPSPAACPALWLGRDPRGLDRPKPLPRAEAGDGLLDRDLRGTHTLVNKTRPFWGSLTLRSPPQHRRL